MDENPIILCIDDDQDDVQLLSDAIKSLDKRYTILEARNGEKAMVQLQEMKRTNVLPCLVVLDLNMPRMNGKETLLNIKNDPELSEVPIVIFSTTSSELDKLFFASEKVEFISKPFHFPQLVHIARKILGYCKDNRQG
jgi:CheY-like chemotaxis protein